MWSWHKKLSWWTINYGGVDPENDFIFCGAIIFSCA